MIKPDDDIFEGKLKQEYSKGAYNIVGDDEQWIRISEGCPNRCGFCAESYENGTKPIYHKIPKIERNLVKIMDMNLIYKPRAKDIIRDLGKIKVDNKVVRYEFVCGIDYRYMTQAISDELKTSRFQNIRFAWDHGLTEQKKIKATIQMLKNSGYRAETIMVFMICNWRIPYEDVKAKMDLCKVWNVKIADCYFDNQISPHGGKTGSGIEPVYWQKDEIVKFRKAVRKHNQLVIFKIDPELKQDKLI